MHATETFLRLADRNRIEMRVRETRQLFSSMDPSPFYERDIDPSAEEFIVACARDANRDEPFRLLLHVAVEPTPREREIAVRAVRAFFEREEEAAGRRLRGLLREGRHSLLVGLVFLAACILTGQLIGSLGLREGVVITREGLTIAGWVAMWRPMETFLYGWWPIARDRRMFRRLAAARLEIVADVPYAPPGRVA